MTMRELCYMSNATSHTFVVTFVTLSNRSAKMTKHEERKSIMIIGIPALKKFSNEMTVDQSRIRMHWRYLDKIRNRIYSGSGPRYYEIVKRILRSTMEYSGNMQWRKALRDRKSRRPMKEFVWKQKRIRNMNVNQERMRSRMPSLWRKMTRCWDANVVTQKNV